MVKTPYFFDKMFVISKMNFETGAMIGEIKYNNVPNLQFSEFRLNTEVQNTANDNIYITTSVRGYHNQEFVQPFLQSMFLRIKIVQMSIQKFAYYQPPPVPPPTTPVTQATGVETVALDHQVSKVENYIYVYHRYRVFNNTYAPCIAKLLKDDFSVVDIQYASAAALI